MKKSIASCIALSAIAGLANAQSFFVFQEDTMYRTLDSGSTIDSFDLGRTFISSTFSPDGRIVGFDARPRTNALINPAHEVVDPFGAAPSINQIDDGVGIGVSSLTYINGRAFGVDTDNFLREFDPVTLAGISVIGNIGFNANGLGYDAANDILYAVDKSDDTLKTINYNDASSATIGSLGLDIENAGAEFFNGVLYASVQNRSSGNLEVGTIDVTTGAFTTLFAVDSFPNPDQERLLVSLAVIPAPGTVALAGLGGLVAVRRRR